MNKEDEEELRKLEEAYKKAKAEAKKLKTPIGLLEELKERKNLTELEIAAIDHTIGLIPGTSNMHNSDNVEYMTY